jgi:hypothetical protein
MPVHQRLDFSVLANRKWVQEQVEPGPIPLKRNLCFDNSLEYRLVESHAYGPLAASERNQAADDGAEKLKKLVHAKSRWTMEVYPALKQTNHTAKNKMRLLFRST